ncbi:hypothetical protein CRV24_007493 [Beauveria bassiana]|nr:hypothetical protein CRV24_007493 [Beauveria bassiana]
MKLSAALAAAVLAAGTTTALPAVAEAVAEAAAAVLAATTTALPARRAGGRGKGGGDLAHPKPIALTLTHPKTIPDDGRGIEKSDFENFGEELMRRAGRHRPIVDHTPVERRHRRADDAGKPVADAFWGMPVVEHVPVPDTRREVAAEAAELESRREPFPIVDHKPSEP